MPDNRRSYDSHFKEGAVQVVRDTGRSIAKVADELGVPKATLTNWVREDRQRRGERASPATVDIETVRKLEKENAELRMERDVLKRSVVLWVKEAMR
jgi:transposase